MIGQGKPGWVEKFSPLGNRAQFEAARKAIRKWDDLSKEEQALDISREIKKGKIENIHLLPIINDEIARDLVTSCSSLVKKSGDIVLLNFSSLEEIPSSVFGILSNYKGPIFYSGLTRLSFSDAVTILSAGRVSFRDLKMAGCDEGVVELLVQYEKMNKVMFPIREYSLRHAIDKLKK